MLKKDRALFYHQRIFGKFNWETNLPNPIYKKIGQACVKNMTDSSIVAFSLKNSGTYKRSSFISAAFMDKNKLRLWDTAQMIEDK